MTVGILGMGTVLPSLLRTNKEVAEEAGVTEEWIIERTGIKRRYIAPAGVAASDLGSEAIQKALRAADIDANQLGLIIVATTTPDEVPGPSTACHIQSRIGAEGAVAFDIVAACSGWVYGLNIANDWVKSHGGYAAVVTADLYARFVDTSDRATAALFSDGAAATIVGNSDHGIIDIILRSDGRHAHDIITPAGGSRIPTTVESINGNLHTVKMRGHNVAKFAMTVFPEMLDEICKRNNITLDDIDLIASHQPNPRLLARIGHNAGVPSEKLIIVGDEIGNVGSSSSSFAMVRAAKDGLVKPGSKVLSIVFGAGATWGASLFTWSGANVIE